MPVETVAAGLSLSVLGRFQLSFGDRPLPAPSLERARTLLTYLVLRRGTDVARERLLELFWPDADPERARGNLNTALWSARRCFRAAGADPEQFLVANKSTIRWIAKVNLDVEQFIALASNRHPESQRSALALYKGDFLEGCYDDWSVAERERISGIFESLLASIVKQTRDPDAAQRLIARNPYGEDAYAVLIDAELAAGRPFTAAAFAEKCRSALKEVGAASSPAFEAAYASLTNHAPQTDTSETVRFPFVGRDTELAILNAAFLRAAAGEGSVALVCGEAGIGKTALLARAARLAEEHHLRILFILSGGVDMDFGPWPSLYESLTGESFKNLLATPSGNTAVEIAEQLQAALPKASAILIDDAHQLHGEALNVLEKFVERGVRRHAIVVGVRPEGAPGLRKLLSSSVACEEIQVGPLARETWANALKGAVEDGEASLLDPLYDRTEGHPLFFCGLVDSLVQKGTLQRRNGRWRLTARLEPTLELPSTLKSFIEARLRARGDNAASVASAVALEPIASSEDIAAALDLDEEAVLDAIDDLIALGLISQRAVGPQMQFSHDLVREVASTLLNAGRQARLHRSYAKVLETNTAAGATLRRAGHLALCQQHESAAEAYARAAEEALGSAAARDALDRCEAGINAIDHAVQTDEVRILRARLEQLRSQALLEIGRAEAAVVAANASVTNGRRSLERQRLALLLLTRAEAYGCVLRPDYQLRDCAEILELSSALNDRSLQARAFCLAAQAHRMQGSPSDAVQTADQAYRIAAACCDWQVAAIAASELLKTQLTWWRFADTRRTLEDGFRAAAKAGPHAESTLALTRAMLWYAMDRHVDALHDLRAAKSLAAGAEVQALPYGIFGPSWQQLFFLIEYMQGLVEAAAGDRDSTLAADDLQAKYTELVQVPTTGNAVALARIDSLLRRAGPEDAERAAQLARALAETSVVQSELAWSDCPALALARIAARLGSEDTPHLMRTALDAIEANGHRTPLLVDRAFEALAQAAEEAHLKSISRRAQERSEDYHKARITAIEAFSRWPPRSGSMG